MSRAAIATLLVSVLIAAASGCADESESATSSATAGSGTADGSDSDSNAASGAEPSGFSTVRAVITEADGDVCEVCLWLADEAEERARGLMGVTDLGDAVGMVFRFDEPTLGPFYMFQTPTPLSIAWFAPDGAHVGTAEMAPCLDTPAGECPLYGPDREYDLAVEVFSGGLEALGLGPGSRLELVEGSESDECSAAAGDSSPATP
jgi:uncharacterized membrane protein (UPF0127 family)